MPGRQSHGRPLLGSGPSSSKGKGRSKNKASKKKALDAFAIAQEEYGDRLKQNPRNRGLDAELSGRSGAKHARDEEDDDDDDDYEEDEDGAPPRKMRRGAGGRARADEDIEYGSDSSGNEWQIGVPDDDDSEIDSDEAFGESDEEKFDGYAFRGSKNKNKKQADEDDEDEDDEDDEDDDIDDADGASLGSDAIDLAAALDMSMSEDEGGPDAGREEQDSDSDDESGSEESKSGDESSDIDDDEVDDVSESGINEWVSQFAGVEDAEEETTSTTTKPKINLKDLGLLKVKDPELKKSLKLMSKEEKTSKPKKLDVPLARRQQAQIDRAAAYEKTKQSLDRWTETVKHNRRADHLVFPLPQNEIGLARHDNTEIMPLNQKAAGTELEQTIMAIIEESGLGPSAEKEKKNTQDDDEIDGEGLSRTDRKALWQQKRRERELKSREDARAKRIAKIKSKAYHRVHKKQDQREAMKEHEAKVAAGEIDSEEEREAQDRQRAMERMGARHRESKWAKMSNKGGRAAWDESVRTGVTDMARRDEELRRRIEGKSSKAHDDDDSDSDYSGDSEDGDERKRLLRQLNDVSAAEDTEPKSKLMSMDFMQKAENAKKKANDELIAQMRKELGSDNDDQSGSDDEPEYIGRRKFGQPSEKTEKPNEPVAKARKQGISKGDIQEARENFNKTTTNRSKGLSAPITQEQTTNPTAGAWSQAATSGHAKKQKGKSGSGAVVLDFGADSVVIAPSAGPVKSSKPSKKPVAPNDDYSSDDDDIHKPIEFHEQELIERAFGGLDVVGEFEKEKAAIESEDDEKIVDNTLPGWGSWAGEGISNREKNRHKGRFLTKKDGVKKKDRKDAKLKNVIISEKIVKKNTKFMASQLPHPFDSRATYEQSLRLPMGPEWLTKESFQDVTKPKVLMKQGIIAPISKPTH
ncbi:Utp14 protein-domain-containing protein [Biscogniauxia mediterranea]|nr:Utp14 protein-domain-containing protein [Biscogniauxia mediterranea]